MRSDDTRLRDEVVHAARSLVEEGLGGDAPPFVEEQNLRVDRRCDAERCW
jgi:hypothetical protein